jgi:predicted NodU family carbamoyl transferase
MVQLLRGMLDVPVFVPVAPHDGGLAIGGAWYALTPSQVLSSS